MWRKGRLGKKNTPDLRWVVTQPAVTYTIVAFETAPFIEYVPGQTGKRPKKL